MESKKLLGVIIALVLIVVGSVVLLKVLDKKVPEPEPDPVNPTPIVHSSNFDENIIKEVNGMEGKKNYLVSPLSISYALSIVNEGAKENTKAEIDGALGSYTLPKIRNVENRISIANLLFVRTKYEKDISKDYIKTVQNKYTSDLIFDPFTTPKKANDWINEKTYNMINDPINDISPDFVLGIANAIAIDVEWRNKFECASTKEADFTLQDNTKMKTAMMHSSKDVDYFKNDKAEGIIKDYMKYDSSTGKSTYETNENTVALEYIAILPKGDLKEYINNFSIEELKSLMNTKDQYKEYDVYYSLPKYTYDYTFENLNVALKNLGIKDAFNPETANFKGMIDDKSDLNVFISKAIHKTHIELSENGTKAAAVTIFMMDATSAWHEEPPRIDIVFDKPFLYIIKEKDSDAIWFFGTVYEPLKWSENKDVCKYE